MDWPHPVFIRGETGLFFFFLLLPSQSFFSPPAPPGGLFHRNVHDLQRVNRPDRPGRADWWAEGEGDRGQAQRVACSVHCRRWLREESWKLGRAPFMPLWMDCTLFRLLRPVSKRTESDYQLVSLWPHQPSFLLHYTPMFHTQTLCNSKQLKCHIN